METDPDVILLGEDIAGGGGREDQGIEEAWGGIMGATKGLYKAFGPQRVLDTPISEMGFLGVAVGAAATGLRPVAELMFMDFLGVSLDPLLNQAAKLRYMFGGKARVPLTVRTSSGAGLRSAAQHSQTLYGITTAIPGLKTVCPSTPADAKGLLLASIRDDNPVVFCEPKSLMFTAGEVPEGEVLDLRTLQPLDEDAILATLAKNGSLVVIDEAPPRCSIANDVAALCVDRGFDSLNAPVRRVTAPHAPVPFSPTLEDLYVPSAQDVIDAVRSLG
jgi:pyruvate dehydrogenase E1 component beta subunit